MANKGRVKATCKCGKTGFIKASELQNIVDDGLKWMCVKCDERETFKQNGRSDI